MAAKTKRTKSITSEKRLETMLAETEAELEKLQPQIERLEKQVEKLKALKLNKQKLITLKLSLKAIVENFSDANSGGYLSSTHFSPMAHLPNTETVSIINPRIRNSFSEETRSKVFLPDKAFESVNQVLRRQTSLNYEIFRAIVFNGGQASTEAIKQYLIDNNIAQPSTGESFDHTELTEISSRANYLVRKGLVVSDGRGHFLSKVGWIEETDE